jgi:Ulp1 family protease
LSDYESKALAFLENFCPDRRVISASVGCGFNLIVHECELLNLLGNSWVSDSVIETLMLIACSYNKKICYINSHMLENLSSLTGEEYTSKAQRIALKIRRRVDALYEEGVEVEYFIAPLNVQKKHWALAIVSLVDGCILTYEPFKYYAAEHGALKVGLKSFLEIYDPFRKWHCRRHGPDIMSPVQKDGSGCGIFIVRFTDIFATSGVLVQKELWGQADIGLLRLDSFCTLLSRGNENSSMEMTYHSDSDNSIEMW